MPLFLRISITEWMEWSGKESWDLEQSIRLAHMLPGLGVDLLDCSSGGNSHEQKVPAQQPGYQVDLAGTIRKSLRTGASAGGEEEKETGPRLLIGAVGLITTAEGARDIVQDKCLYMVGGDPEKGDTDSVVSAEGEYEDQSKADVVLIARQFLREPEFVLRVAQHLGVRVKWANQYGRAEWPENQKV